MICTRLVWFGVYNPIPFDNPLAWKSLPPSMNSLLTYLESLLCVVVRFPSTLVRGWLYTDLPPFLPIPFCLPPTVPYFKYMPSYDDITISTSHSLIQFHSHATVQREYGEYESRADGCVRVTETPSPSKHNSINAVQGSHRERRGLKGKSLGPLLAKMSPSSGGSPKKRLLGTGRNRTRVPYH